MEETYALISPAPSGSGEKYFFLGYMDPRYVDSRMKHDCFHINIPSYITPTYNPNNYKIQPTQNDCVRMRRISPYIPRLRNHIFLIDVNDYSEAKRIYNVLVDVGVAKDDEGWSAMSGGLDKVEEMVRERLDDNETPEKIFEDMFQKHRAINYIMRVMLFKL